MTPLIYWVVRPKWQGGLNCRPDLLDKLLLPPKLAVLWVTRKSIAVAYQNVVRMTKDTVKHGDSLLVVDDGTTYLSLWEGYSAMIKNHGLLAALPM